jgi:hypothetical protein
MLLALPAWVQAQEAQPTQQAQEQVQEAQPVQEAKPIALEANALFDWDSNVTQQPNNSIARLQVPGRGDATFSQSASAEYTLFQNKPFTLPVKYSLFQNFHPRLSQNDTLMHTVSITPTYLRGSTQFSLPAYYGYTDVQSDKYTTSYILTPTIFHRFSPEWGLEVGGNFIWQENWVLQTNQQYEGGGNNYGGKIGGYYFIGDKGGYLQARFSYDYFAAQGRNNRASIYHLLLAGFYPFTEKLSGQLFVDFNTSPYTFHYNDSTYINGVLTPFPKRDDKGINLGLVGTYKIYKGFEAGLHYYFTALDSNISLYAYNKHVIGGTLTYRY